MVRGLIRLVFFADVLASIKVSQADVAVTFGHAEPQATHTYSTVVAVPVCVCVCVCMYVCMCVMSM